VAGAAPDSHRLPYGTVPMTTKVAAPPSGVNAALRSGRRLVRGRLAQSRRRVPVSALSAAGAAISAA